MSATDAPEALRRRWPVIAVVTLIAALIAYFGTAARPPAPTNTYRATNVALAAIGEHGSVDAADAGPTAIAVTQVPALATRGEVPTRVAAQLGYTGTLAALTAGVSVTADARSGTVSFVVEDSDAERAVLLADTFAAQTAGYLAERQAATRERAEIDARADMARLEDELAEIDQQLQTEIAADPRPAAEGSSITRARRDAVADEYTTALATHRQVTGIGAGGDLRLTTLEPARAKRVEAWQLTLPRSRSTRVPIAAAIGALLGAGVALVIGRFDTRLRDRRGAAEAFDAAVIGEIPTLGRTDREARSVVRSDAHGPAAEAFRSLRTALTVLATGDRAGGNNAHDGNAHDDEATIDVRQSDDSRTHHVTSQPAGSTAGSEERRVGVILVTSAGAGEGKTTVVTNLAVAFAETERSVLVVNADFRHPAITTALAPGAKEPLRGGLAAMDRVGAREWLRHTVVPGVQLLDLSSLPQAPGELTRASAHLLRPLVADFDVVLIDSPPLAFTAEALEFSSAATITLLVGRLGRTTADAARRAGELARVGGTGIVAVVTNGAERSARADRRYYGDAGRRDLSRRHHPTNRPSRP